MTEEEAIVRLADLLLSAANDNGATYVHIDNQDVNLVQYLERSGLITITAESDTLSLIKATARGLELIASQQRDVK
jgi:hypothetical protein